ncbi:MAG: 50S ribosomal protein L9 [Rhodospirillales bacterium]|nr:50S ribosomal protein L9 [Rhodospirillales bacterium]MDH3791731.1 50S ribosomal protein L9 [Rhodospirillales bacterium]MDH3911675.1 50S ribosomal protein L9 [Rhodospirillales bacterium]MDH3968754.1 50S ribosomal protein L9 [Rhodospirillales bacterium]
MEVILMERVEKLGLMGDVVKVKPGYARNYLLPQKKALRANKDNLALFETQRTQLEADNLKLRKEAGAIAAKLEGLVVVLIRQAGDNGQLYGSVTARDLAQAITEAGFTVDRKQIVLEKAIKVLGLHPVKIRLHPEVVVEVTANVARSEAEAESQAETGHLISAEEQRETEEAAVEAIVAEVEETEQAEAEEAEAATPASEESEAETRA